LRLVLLIQKIIIKIQNKIDITLVNNKLTNLFNYNSLYSIVNIINIFIYKKKLEIANFKINYFNIRQTLLFFMLFKLKILLLNIFSSL